MRRRALLATLPAAGILTTAGCMDRARSALDREPEARELDPDTTTPIQSWVFEEGVDAEIRPDDAAGLIAIGSGDDSHWLTVAAESEETVETTVSIAGSDGELLYEETFGLSSQRYFGVRFEHVQAYEVTVETDRHEETVEVAEHWIDCNHSTQAVFLATDGGVRVGGASTDMAC